MTVVFREVHCFGLGFFENPLDFLPRGAILDGLIELGVWELGVHEHSHC